MITTGHIVAAFVGVLFLAYAMADGFPDHGKVASVAIIAVLFGFLWECVIRLSRLLRRLLGR